jgi:predicted ATPase
MLLLTSLALERLGPFQEKTVLPLVPITHLFGDNGAGKSAILYSLLLLKQCAIAPPEDGAPC